MRLALLLLCVAGCSCGHHTRVIVGTERPAPWLCFPDGEDLLCADPRPSLRLTVQCAKQQDIDELRLQAGRDKVQCDR